DPVDTARHSPGAAAGRTDTHAARTARRRVRRAARRDRRRAWHPGLRHCEGLTVYRYRPGPRTNRRVGRHRVIDRPVGAAAGPTARPDPGHTARHTPGAPARRTDTHTARTAARCVGRTA